jgi:hypothetical protein
MLQQLLGQAYTMVFEARGRHVFGIAMQLGNAKREEIADAHKMETQQHGNDGDY